MCDPSRDTQKWSFEKYDAQRLAKWDQAGPGLQLLDLPSLSFFRSIVRKSLIPIVKKKRKKKIKVVGQQSGSPGKCETSGVVFNIEVNLMDG